MNVLVEEQYRHMQIRLAMDGDLEKYTAEELKAAAKRTVEKRIKIAKAKKAVGL